MKKIVKNFLLMIQFFTRIPINRSLPCSSKDFRDGAAMLPLVGFIIGGLQAILYILLSHIMPLGTTVLFTLLACIIITGGLHIDGLGDMCDGFFAFKGNDKIIEIMKDSRIGTYACVTIVFDILIKYSLLVSFSFKKAIVFIILLPVISRFLIVFLSYIGKNAKPNGTGNLFIGNMGKRTTIIALIFTIIIVIPTIGIISSAIIFFTVIAFSLLFNMYCNSKIGGLTGDTLGACCEIAEILILIIAANIY